jgi:hypothetical protein
VQQECRNPGHQVAETTKFCLLALNILVSSVRVTLLMSRIFRSPRFLENLWTPGLQRRVAVIIWL